MSSVAIIGGGPAGMATAISLVQTDPLIEVIVIERSEYETIRIGETLPPTAEPLLKQLGVWDRFVEAGHQPAFHSLSAWGSTKLLTNEFIEQPRNRGWHLDRQRFDRMLGEEAVRKGVQLLSPATVSSFTKDHNGWNIAVVDSKDNPFEFHVDFIVDATGRRSTVAASKGAKRVSYDRLLAIMAFLNIANDREVPCSTMIETCEDGWWYSSSVPGNQLIVACMTDNDIAKRELLRHTEQWWSRLKSMPHTYELVNNAFQTDPKRSMYAIELRVVPASSTKLDRCTGANWLAVGDAASTFDPLSSMGVFKALRTGILASYAICDYFRDNPTGLARYERLVQQEFDSYLATRTEFYSEERRWPTSPFWSRRSENITIDPMRSIVLADTEKLSTIEKLPMNLMPSDIRTLCALCEQPALAHEVVASFLSRSNAMVSDQRVILTLQQLFEHGIIHFN